ncbi:MAG: alpha-N-arabinofuranosidase [Actinomycetota bacterium]|nr:alpha-N-arabinofuranosidase [Actinomycetota bacterium]
MTKTELIVDPEFVIGDVDRRLFGSFVEHMGRCVYGGVFEPGHPAADEQGQRTDVIDLTKELGVSIVRYPGGNFVSGYRWEDGVGPVADRPTRLDLAWRSVESNQFGLHEFMDWAAKAGVEPMLAVNLGTRGVAEAADLVEYANHPGGTTLSDLRAANGHPEPFGIKLWCLGNEMDGPWQIGHKSADDYGKLAAEAGKAMKLVDPSIELVVCGSSGRGMATFGQWEAEVLAHTYDQVDYISLHAYYEEESGDLESFLASAVDIDAFIDEVVSTCDYAKALQRSDKTMRLSFDEWNVWYQKAYHSQPTRNWEPAPHLIEDDFSVVDAVVVGSYLISLLNHADRVGVACQAQLANIIAPIRTEPAGPAWRQTIFHPFALMAQYAHGRALQVPLTTASIPTARFGDVPGVQCAATHDEQTGRLALFLVNRNSSEAHDLQVDLRTPGDLTVLDHQVLADDDIRATNSAAAPDRVTPTQGGAKVVDGALVLSLPPVSFSVVVLGPPGITG